MDPDQSHTLPTPSAGQTNPPHRGQEWASSSMGSEHTDGGGRPQTYSSDNPLDSTSEPPSGNSPHRNVGRDLRISNATQSREGHTGKARLAVHGQGHLISHVVPVVPEALQVGSSVASDERRSDASVPSEKHRTYWPFMQEKLPVQVIVESYKYGTFNARLQETILAAELERNESIRKVQWTGWLLNIAIVLQVIFGALTTGLSATLSAKQIGVVIPVLGGMSTAVAAYVAQARGSGEPDLSKAHVKKINQFLRECRAFIDDHGDKGGKGSVAVDGDGLLNERLKELRKRFEELLGNTDGQGKAMTRILVRDSDGDPKK